MPVPAGENRILLLHQHPESVMLEITPATDGSWAIRELRACWRAYVGELLTALLPAG